MNEVRKCHAIEIFSAPNSAELIAEYEAECANAVLGPTRAQRERYQDMEVPGLGQCFAAYVDGRLCGFAMVLTVVVPHYGVAQASVESLFVEKASRRTEIGLRLMQAMEAHAKEHGCKAIFYTAPVGSKLARLLFLEPDVYVHTNHVFTKSLQ